jgi:DNA-binding MurR/RpiR family transcriptional regulator
MTHAEGRVGRAEPWETVADRVRTGLGQLSPSERKVARELLSNYPLAGLETIAELAARAQVSAPTVMRFATRVGFPSYPEMQRALMREVHEQMGSPLRQLADSHSPGGSLQPPPGAAQNYLNAVSRTFSTLPDAEVQRAAELLADPKLRVHTIGGRFSRALATYLTAHLLLMRSDVATVPDQPFEQATALLDMGRRDLIVVFDFRRYDRRVVEFAQAGAARGARVVLFTDPWLSRSADVADVVLSAEVEAIRPFDSLVPAMAVVESVVTAVLERLGDRARARLAELEQ